MILAYSGLCFELFQHPRNKQLTFTSTFSTTAFVIIGNQFKVYFTLACPPATGRTCFIAFIMVFTASKKRNSNDNFKT